MLSNAYFLAKFRFDTAENEPVKNLQKIAKFSKNSFFENFEIAAVQKDANLVELEKRCRTHIFLQKFVLIQPRTSPPKICNILQHFTNFANPNADRVLVRHDVEPALAVVLELRLGDEVAREAERHADDGEEPLLRPGEDRLEEEGEAHLGWKSGGRSR